MEINHELTELYLFPIDETMGYIYYLFDKEDEILYIGQTICLHSRISTHRRAKKIPFNNCKFFKCPRNELDEIESSEIILHSPRFNVNPPKSSTYFSLDGYKKLDPFVKGKIPKVKRIIREQNIKNQNGYYHINDLNKISSLMRHGV